MWCALRSTAPRERPSPASTARASSTRPWIASHRGDSGITKATARKSATGVSAPQPMMTRHEPDHDEKMTSMRSPTAKPRTWPPVMAISLQVTK